VSKAKKRYYRTIILGVLALATLLWAAVDQFGLSYEEMAQLFVATLLVVGGVIVLAALVALIWVGLRRLLGGG
jgi:hypothetical protein